MRNLSAAGLDRVLRSGPVLDPIGILEPGVDSGRLVGHFVPAGYRPDEDELAPMPTQPEAEAVRLARLEMEVADGRALVERLLCRMEDRAVKPRSRWQLAAIRRRGAWAALRDGELSPEDTGGTDND